jgi:hypothetical protein
MVEKLSSISSAKEKEAFITGPGCSYCRMCFYLPIRHGHVFDLRVEDHPQPVAELKFQGTSILFMAGEAPEALALLRDVFAREPQWAELVPRLAAVGIMPDDPVVLKYILDQRP